MTNKLPKRKLSPDTPDLWMHQAEAVKIATPQFALFFDPGTGKTRTSFELVAKYIAKHGPCKIMIFAPLNVCRNWPNEADKYLGYPHEIYMCAGQLKNKKLEELKRFKDAKSSDSIHLLICNTESLRSKYYRDLLKVSGAKILIADESHNFKTPSSLQTKGLIEVEAAFKPERLYLLTGTPAPQGEIDLWSTFYLLKKTKDSFFVWRKRHFVDKNERMRGTSRYWPDYVITARSRELFQKILAECSMTASKDLVLDLPPLLRTQIYASLSPEQARHYETMKEYLFAIDEDGNELNASNLLSRTLRLQQILAGFIGDAPIKANDRLNALDAAIEMTCRDTTNITGKPGKLGGEQFLIWTIFAATYKQISDRLTTQGILHGFLTGEQSAEERHQTMQQFQDGQLRALICHPRAGGVGVNLTAASYSIHYTRNYNLVDDLQCEARNYRGGSEIHKRITRIDIVTPNSIDEDITEALRNKKTVQDFILGLKKGRCK